jgi:hypothetical protein
MRRSFALISLGSLIASPGLAAAAYTGAAGNGDWSSTATWTNGVPASTDNAYIGATYPAGSAATAAVTLNQNSSAGDVLLGNDPGTTGTLDLSGLSLTAGNIWLGSAGGSGSLMRTGGGTVSIANNFNVYNGAFAFAAGDTTNNLNLYGTPVAVTAAVGNITTGGYIDPGATLNLGADLTLSGTLDVRGTLNANGHALNVYALALGQSGGPARLNDRGTLTIGNLYLSGQYSPSLATFNFTTADSVAVFYLNGGTSVATVATGNLTGSVSMAGGTTLNLGADLVLSSGLDLKGTLNANGHSITSPSVDLGYGAAYTVNNRGPIATNFLGVSSQDSPGQTTFNLTTADAVKTFALAGTDSTLLPGVSVTTLDISSITSSTHPSSIVNTTATGNVTSDAFVGPGSTLNLGADLNLHTLTVWGDLNCNGHSIAATQVSLGDGGPITLTKSRTDHGQHSPNFRGIQPEFVDVPDAADGFGFIPATCRWGRSDYGRGCNISTQASVAWNSTLSL